MLKKVVIIGAGPAGLLLAHYLLRRGNYQVEIYERRPDPRLVDPANDRTFPISLQERGQKALREIPGLEELIFQQSVPCQGTIVYRKKSKKKRILKRKKQVFFIDRNRLMRVILEHLFNQYTDRKIQVKFGVICTQINPQTQSVILESEAGECFEASYDLLVGADGARSVVRDYLAENTGLKCEKKYAPDAYKSVFLDRTNPQLDIELEGDRIHTCNLDNNTRIILVPQKGNQLNGTLIFNAENNPLENFSTKEEVLQFFQASFPAFAEVMSLEEAEELLKRPIARVLTICCDRFHEGNHILLIGDAAHAVSPSIGQGCNSALQDVLILNNLLEKYGDNWEQVLPQFSQQRVPDAHALQELSNYSFPRTKLLVTEFFFRLTLGRLLHKWFPRTVKPFIFDLVLDTDLPYSEVLNLSQSWINKVKRSQQLSP